MKISAKAEYACLAVLALARQGPESSPLHIREISEAMEFLNGTWFRSYFN